MIIKQFPDVVLWQNLIRKMFDKSTALNKYSPKLLDPELQFITFFKLSL